MKEIFLFDTIGRLQLRAVEREDTDIAHLKKQLPLTKIQLYEVWVIPKKGQGFTADDVQEMHVHELRKVIDLYDPELSDAPIHAISKQIDLLETFAKDLAIGDARFKYDILYLSTGPVLSIVFGNSRAMSLSKMKEQFRQKI